MRCAMSNLYTTLVYRKDQTRLISGHLDQVLQRKCLSNCFRIYPKYPARLTLANSVDPDQTPQNAASDQGLHRLPLIQKYLNARTGSKMDRFSKEIGCPNVQDKYNTKTIVKCAEEK